MHLLLCPFQLFYFFVFFFIFRLNVKCLCLQAHIVIISAWSNSLNSSKFTLQIQVYAIFFSFISSFQYRQYSDDHWTKPKKSPMRPGPKLWIWVGDPNNNRQNKTLRKSGMPNRETFVLMNGYRSDFFFIISTCNLQVQRQTVVNECLKYDNI